MRSNSFSSLGGAECTSIVGFRSISRDVSRQFVFKMAAPVAATDESWLRTRDVLVPGGPEDFGSLLLSAPVLEGLRAAGFLRPSPVQLKAIPLGRCGLDLIVQAKSGTGKTCVFSTIALDSLILESPVTQILVLAPTREIAVQIHAVITTIGIKMEGLECHVFIGGTPLNQDKIRLKKCHIAVGSPGRIKQLIELDYLNTASIRLFILDEADKLLEEGSFQEQINWIYSSLPVNKQMLAVSATYPESLANTLTRYMRDPTFVRLNPTDPSLIGLKQYFKVVNSHPLPHKTFEEKAQHLQELFSKIPFNQALVFSNLHSRAQHLADLLASKGFPAECISGNMNQNQRLDAMAKLKQFHCRVLISTDLTSRGIDAEKVNLVINLDVPLDWETYMHRIGRAGRFGTLGLAVTYCCRGEEENVMMNIAQKCNLRLLPLPEPVPPELMEQFEGWDVEVTAVPYPNASLHTALPAKQPEGTVQLTAGGSSAKESSVVACENFSAPKPRQALKQKQLLKSRTEHSNTKRTIKDQQSSQCTAKPKWQLKSGVQTSGQQNKQEVDKEALRNKLPKIPCLSSYKTHQSTNTWSMAKFVEDYEYFIKEGLEKDVEIIRSYTGPGEQHSGNSALDWKGMEPSACAADAWTGESDSDSSTYSSGSLAYSSDDQSHIKASSDTQKGNDGELAADQTFQRHFQQFSAVPEPKLIPESPLLQKIKQNVKQSKHSRQNCHLPTAKPSKRRGMENAPQNYPDPPFFCETQSYKEYWKRYYRAYQDYYSTASYSYNCMYNWLTAYRAQAVYIEELLRGHQ
ncbi:probable ATP-dependent RNA helicase DDX20 [Heteronotia binoei]|uniref:probable ATP-dependent RNA helicase DDX20 n=1 Tax=Heteronotia binoei TaxID=13085 RepID=UPI002931EF41|nr:probable ATP-dependent RNA helicase DDX20 [Heteronotia binoei]